MQLILSVIGAGFSKSKNTKSNRYMLKGHLNSFNLRIHVIIDRLLQVENIEDKLEHLNKRFDDFLGKYNELCSELRV